MKSLGGAWKWTWPTFPRLVDSLSLTSRRKVEWPVYWITQADLVPRDDTNRRLVAISRRRIQSYPFVKNFIVVRRRGQWISTHRIFIGSVQIKRRCLQNSTMARHPTSNSVCGYCRHCWDIVIITVEIAERNRNITVSLTDDHLTSEWHCDALVYYANKTGN